MENMDIILNAITTVGFPIAACIAMFYMYNNVTNGISNLLKDNTLVMKDMKDTMKEMKDALNGLTTQLSILMDRIERLEEKVDDNVTRS